MCCSKQTSAERFTQDEYVSRLRATFGENMFRMDDAGDCQAVFRFFIHNGMSSGNNAACLHNGVHATTQNSTKDSWLQVIWPCHQIDCHKYLATHCIYIADGIGGSDCAKSVRIIYHRREKIRCANNCLLLVRTVHSGIIDSVQTD